MKNGNTLTTSDKESNKRIELDLAKTISDEILKIINAEKERRRANSAKQNSYIEEGNEEDYGNHNFGLTFHHRCRILFPFKFYIAPRMFKNMYTTFSSYKFIFNDQEAMSSQMANELSFLSPNARIHSEIVDIFDNSEKDKDNILFGLFDYNFAMLDEKASKAMDAMLWESAPEKTSKQYLEIKNESARLYLFESGIGFFEWQIKFNWSINVSNELIVKFCNGIRSKMDCEWLCKITEKIFALCSQKSKQTNDEKYDFFDRKPFYYITIELAKSKEFYFEHSIHRMVLSNRNPSFSGDDFLVYSNGGKGNKNPMKYIHAESNSLIRVGRYKWEINDQATWFCLIFVLHQKYALSSLSNELMKIDGKHLFSPSRMLRRRLRQEEINYANFRRRYVFENISNKTDVETIYDYLRERFEINKLLCEYVDSIMPLQNYSRTSRERYRNNILFAFSVTTAINIIVGYFKYIVNIESTTKQGLVFFSVFFALLLVFNVGIIILTAISSAQARKQLINRTKSNCVKNVDKHKRL